MAGRVNYKVCLVLSFLVAAFLISAQTAFADPNLISHWKFDEGSGTTAYDSAGSNDGTITGATWTTGGKINGALSFDASGDYVYVPGLTPANKGTFAAWVKSNVDITNLSPRRSNNTLLYSNGNQIRLGSSVSGYQGNLRFFISPVGGRYSILYSNKNSWNTNEWYHITCTWDGTIQAVYVNGLLDKSQGQAYSGGWGATYIGGFSGISSYSFDGVIDDVRIYNRALFAGEIERLYLDGLGLAPNPANGATGVNPNVVLSWRSGRDAASHDVYFGTGYSDVNDANTSSSVYMGNFDVNNFDPCGLEYRTTYYWRIDEINGPNIWKGNVWSFETGGDVDGVLYVPSEYSTIQEAIDYALDGYVVIVALGTYTGTGNRDIDFKGKAITVRSTDPNNPNIVAATIIDCQGTSSSPHRGFYFHSGEDANSILNGLTIVNGYAESGGGIYCENGGPTIINCIIKGNTAVTGGGITANGCTITGCAIYGNSSRTKGGGLYCTNCSISHCLIIKNSVLEGEGGGISASDCTISNCIISVNIVAGHNAVQQGNILPDGGNAYGGGLSLTCSLGSEVTVQNCIIYGNKTLGGSGCIVGETEPPLWSPPSIDGGDAYGGGMYCGSEGSFRIENCTFSDNHVVGGPPGEWFVRHYEGGHYEICGDTGDSFGGGICNVSDNALIHQCIFADDTASYGIEVATVKTAAGNPSHTLVSYCDIQTGLAATYVGADCILDWGAGNIDVEPNLTPDGHLCAGSSCINTGDPNFIPEPNATDIDGEPRVMLARVDMGADEFNPFEIDFIVVDKRRVGRTLFEYDCEVTLTNISRFAVRNVQLEIVKASENMVVIDPNVTFGNIEIGPGESATSIDMCTFQVDRSEATEPAEIIWKSTYEMVDGVLGIQDTASGLSFLNLGVAGDITGNGKVDFEDLAILIDQWLQPPGVPLADIAPTPADGIVNFFDYAVLAEHWLEGF